MPTHPNRNLTHEGMQAFLVLQWKPIAEILEVEKELPNGRIADIYMELIGQKIITEIKSVYKMSLLEEAITKYYDHCDYLIYACPPPSFIPQAEDPLLVWPDQRRSRPGILFVHWDKISFYRLPRSKDTKDTQYLTHLPASLYSWQ
jgi:hypothetical protein